MMLPRKRLLLFNQRDPRILLQDAFNGSALNTNFWTATDSENKITVSGGLLNFAGGMATPAFADPALVSKQSWARVPGLTIEWQITPAAANKALWFGFTNGTLDAAGNGEAQSVYFGTAGSAIWAYNKAGGVKTPAVYAAATSCWLRIEARAAGALYSISTDDRVTWSPIFLDTSDTTATLYAFIESYNAALTSRDVYVSQRSITPAVYSGTPAAPSLTLGNELLAGTGFEAPYTSGVADGWSESDSAGVGTPTEETSDVYAGSSSQSYARSGGGVNPKIYQGVTVVAGSWYILSAAYKRLTGASLQIGLRDGTDPQEGTLLNTEIVTSAAWAVVGIAARALTTDLTVWGNFYVNPSSGLLDSFSLKSVAFSTSGLLTYLVDAGKHNGIYQVSPTVSASYQAGIVCHANSATTPTYCLLAYIDRTAAKAYFLKNENGTWTELNAGGTAITYSAGAVLEIISNGTSHSIFYNKAAVAGPYTVAVSSNYGTHVLSMQTLAADSCGATLIQV